MAKLMRLRYPAGGGTTIDFTNPLGKDDPFKQKAYRSVKHSISGIEQVAFDYTDATKDLEVVFESSSVRDALFTFFTSHAALGKTFDIIEDRVGASSTIIVCTIVTDSFESTREAPGTDYWRIKFTIRTNI